MKITQDQSPLVSIGLPIFNGEKFVREAIDSILAQTFTDFELIITDNASSDRTEIICREYAAQDSRIRYYRNKTNIGGCNNHNLTFELSRGKYFCWTAHDDMCDRQMLAKYVKVLENNPSVVLCYSQIMVINESQEHLGMYEFEVARSTKPYKRFRDLAQDHTVNMIYGLIRADILRQTQLQPNYPESDLVFLAELSLYGQFYQLSHPLYYRRVHPDQSVFLYKDRYQRLAWCNSKTREIQQYPMIEAVQNYFYYHWLQFSHCFLAIARAPLSIKERVWCYFYATSWLLQRALLSGTRSWRQRLFLNKNTIKSCLKLLPGVE